MLQDWKQCQTFCQRALYGSSGVDCALQAFAQDEQAKRMIEVGVGEENSGDGTAARCARWWRQGGKRFDLLADIRRGVEKEPALAVRAQRHAGLRARAHGQGALARSPALR